MRPSSTKNDNHQQGAEFLPKTYKNGEGAAVIMNSNYAIDNGLKPSRDDLPSITIASLEGFKPLSMA
jgi:ABC-type metal ion transport system substrate-binding protein